MAFFLKTHKNAVLQRRSLRIGVSCRHEPDWRREWPYQNLKEINNFYGANEVANLSDSEKYWPISNVAALHYGL